MPSLNKTILIGHMTAEPELKQTPSGVSVCSFSIGVSRKYSKDGGQPQSDFINIVAWRTTAEFVAGHFHKGDAICICGAIQTRSWTAQDGGRRYATEVIAEEVNFVERRKQGAESAPKQSFDISPSPDFEELPSDEDLPF